VSRGVLAVRRSGSEVKRNAEIGLFTKSSRVVAARSEASKPILMKSILPANKNLKREEAMTEKMKALTMRAEELWNEGKMAIANEMYAPNFVNHDPFLPQVSGCQ
jgi:hypothetical protein